jgi:hypothetical protein
MTVTVAPILWGAATFFLSLDIVGTVRSWRLAPALLDREPWKPRSSPGVVGKARGLFRRRDPSMWEEVSYSLAFHLRAGEPIAQALRSVATEGDAPAHAALRKAVQLYDAGSSFSAALTTQSRECPELGYLAGIFEMGAASGGDMPTLLCHAAEAMRRKRTIANEVRSRMAEAKTTAVLLSVLPWIIGFVTMAKDPQARAAVLTDPRGRSLLLLALLMWLAGNAATIVLVRSLVPRAARSGSRGGRVKR